MGLLVGSDGGTTFQGPGANALAELVGQFLDGERRLAGTDPLTLEGCLQDAAVICERHAHNLQDTLATAHRNPSMFATLLDSGEGLDGEEGDPNEVAIGELYEYQADMQGPINEPLPEVPDINKMPANTPVDPSQGPNAGFVKTLGIDDPAGGGPPPGAWEEIPHDVDNHPDSRITPDTPREFTASNGLEADLYPNGELQISWIDRLSQLLDFRSLVSWLGDSVQIIKAYVTDGFAQKYFATDALTENTMQRLNNLAASMGFRGIVEKVGGRIWIIFTRIK